MEQLIKDLNLYKKNLPLCTQELLTDERLENLWSVFPFNKFEYIISHLLADHAISIQDYYNLRQAYIERNCYMHLFEMAPRTFGQTWGERHLREFHKKSFLIPNTEYDVNYHGEYDLWMPCSMPHKTGIKIEVKASRVVDDDSDAALIEKALNSSSEKNFDMNFQQLKPSFCDVFIWMAVWLDKIDYWVIQSSSILSQEQKELVSNPDE